MIAAHPPNPSISPFTGPSTMQLTKGQLILLAAAVLQAMRIQAGSGATALC